MKGFSASVILFYFYNYAQQTGNYYYLVAFIIAFLIDEYLIKTKKE